MPSIENLTNPGQPPVDGDLIRETYPNGAIVVRQFREVEPPAPGGPPYQAVGFVAFLELLPSADELQLFRLAKAETALGDRAAAQIAKWQAVGVVDFSEQRNRNALAWMVGRAEFTITQGQAEAIAGGPVP